MPIFLITFFLIYASTHLYFLIRVKNAFVLGPIAVTLLSLFLLFMLFAPVLAWEAERKGVDALARLLAYTGYLWMALLFFFFTFSIFMDVCHISLKLYGRLFGKGLAAFALSAKARFVIPAAYAILAACYGWREAADIRTERIVIRTSKLPAGLKKLRIVQISDVHIGLMVRGERLKRILAAVAAAQPDILVSTGDLLDGQADGLGDAVGLLADIRAAYGKFAVTGNHEYYAGLPQAISFTEKAGFRVLRGEGAEVAGLINIAGVDDSAGRSMGLSREVSEKRLLSGLPRGRFTLLLKHRPAVDEEAAGLFDLQLSGHVHGGQIFPFSIVTRLFYPVKTGFSPDMGGSSLYVSRGAGAWGPPIRFLAPPEVTVIELVPAT